MARPWQRWVVVVGFALLVLVPPGVRLGTTGIAWCEPIGEFREQIGLGNQLTNSQIRAIAEHAESPYFDYETDHPVAVEIAVRACEGARDDRRTLIIVAAIAVAAVVVRRSILEAARRTGAPGGAEAATEEGRHG